MVVDAVHDTETRRYGWRAKLLRAKRHLSEVERIIREITAPGVYRVAVVRPPGSTGLYIIQLQDAPPFPDQELALGIGDCVHSLRCALDYMAWELAGGVPGDTDTSFPIFDSRQGWDRRAERRIKRMPPEAKRLIERLQPFHAADPRSVPLNAIRLLDDADKHKLLTVTVPIQQALSVEFSTKEPLPFTPDDRINIVQYSSLDHDAILATFVLEAAPADVKVQAAFTPTIAFGEDMGLDSRVAVLPSLVTMLNEVTVIAEAVERRFFVSDRANVR